MYGMPHIMSLYTSAEVSWVLLLTGVCLGLLLWSRPRCLSIGWGMYTSLLERRYTDAPRIMSWLLTTVFCVQSTALALYVWHYTSGEFVWSAFLWICLAVVATRITKELAVWLIGYVFGFEQEVRIGRDQRTMMWIVLSLLLFVICAVAVYTPMHTAARVLMATAVTGYETAVLVKLLRVFLSEWKSLFYILIYWLTAEILPLAAMWYAAGLIVN